MLEQAQRRFVSKTLIQPDGCIIWTGAHNAEYGGFRLDGVWAYAHRIAYEHWIGPIPEHLVIDHLCRVKTCVNPLHLEAVTPGENKRRGLPSSRPDLTKCGRGLHDWVDENIYHYHGKDYCRPCRTNRQKERRQRAREDLEAVRHGDAHRQP